jgi:hypothetical protein
VRVSSANYAWTYFSIAMPACSSVLVYVRPISGDPDLYLSQTTEYPTMADYTWYRGRLRSPELDSKQAPHTRARLHALTRARCVSSSTW